MKDRFIIFMGSDGAGKTTIAQGLSEILEFPVHHFGPVKSYEEGKNQYFGFIEEVNDSVICDRFHEGEQIFAPIYRGYKANYFGELEEKLLEKFDPLLVLVEPPFWVIKERLEKRGEDFVKEDDWKYAYDKVWHIYNHSKLPKIRIDSHQYSPEENIKQVMAMM